MSNLFSTIQERLRRKLSDDNAKLERICRETGKVTKLASLLKRRPDINVNEIRFKGWTLLHLCSLHGFVECVEFLLKVGADSSIRIEEVR